MSPTSDLIAAGNLNAQSEQWSAAADNFEAALANLYASAFNAPIPLPIESSLVQPLFSALAEHRFESNITEIQAPVLHDLLQGLHMYTDFPYMWAFQFKDTAGGFTRSNKWLVAFFKNQFIPISGSSLCFSPDWPPAYLIDLESCQYQQLPQDELIRKQIAYVLAHLAQARCRMILDRYREHDIVDGKCCEPLKQHAGSCFALALTLQPDYAWALRHYGEMYRQMANSWHLQSDSELNPYYNVTSTRHTYYVNALLLYNHSLDYQQSSWAEAHLGATIVNFRAFLVGFYDEAEATEALLKYLKTNRPQCTECTSLDDIAIVHLGTAQAAHVYPWAQAYYGWARMFLAIRAQVGPNSDPWVVAGELMEASIFVSDAYATQIGMRFFEPAVLYLNPFFELGVYYLEIANKLSQTTENKAIFFQKAWKAVLTGLDHLSGFDFSPGLEALTGFFLLVVISESIHCYSKSSSANVSFTGSGVCNRHGITVSNVPYTLNNESDINNFKNFLSNNTSHNGVVDFALQISNFAEGPESQWLNTKIEIGLSQMYYILWGLYQLQINGSYVIPDDTRAKVKTRLDNILRLLNIKSIDPDDPYLAWCGQAKGISMSAEMLVFLHTTQPSLAMATVLGRK